MSIYCLIVIPMSASIDLHNPLAIQHGERSIGHEEKARSEVNPNQTDPDSCQKEGGLQESLAKEAPTQGTVCGSCQKEGGLQESLAKEAPTQGTVCFK
jgi:hypothetical protein